MNAAPQRRIRGFALILAVFLIVTLAAVGVYLVTMSTGQVQATSQDEQAARAYQAARAGIEWATYQRLISSTCAATSTLTFTNAGLSCPFPATCGFRAQVTCTRVTPIGGETEGPVAVNVYVITSLGCNTGASVCSPSPATPGGPTYVERALSITVTQ